MPQAANITVKNHALADKVFTLMTAASGEGGVARWALKEGGSPVAYPTMTISAKATSNRSRKTQVKIRIPYHYTDATTGLVKAGPAYEFNGDFSVADEFPEAMRNDAVAFVANLTASLLVKEVCRDGYPAN